MPCCAPQLFFFSFSAEFRTNKLFSWFMQYLQEKSPVCDVCSIAFTLSFLKHPPYFIPSPVNLIITQLFVSHLFAGISRKRSPNYLPNTISTLSITTLRKARTTNGDLPEDTRLPQSKTFRQELPTVVLVFEFPARWLKRARVTWRTGARLPTVIRTE